jgi:glycosyltransferase involved in cell wall biosynthesis
MSNRPLLSIIIPTQNRYTYLRYLIDLLIGYRLPELEVIIQDNTNDNTEIKEFLSSRDLSSVKYFHYPTPIPIADNVDRALKQTTGEYVCFIGDDDGVLPNIIECVKWMKQQGIEALRPAVTIYNWPDYIDTSPAKLSGVLIHDAFASKATEVNIKYELQKLASRGFKHIYTLPKIYQGIVKRSCLEELYAIGQTFTPGPSPDMATAVALCFVVKKFVIIDVPVVLIGQCVGVGGGERKLKGAVKRIEDVPFLPVNAKENWDQRLPKVWCSQTVWPESALKALVYMQKENAVQVNFEYIYTWFIQTHPADWRLAWQLSGHKIKLFAYLSYYRIWVPFRNLFRNQPNRAGHEYVVRDIHTINDAARYLITTHADQMEFKNIQYIA